MVEGWNVRPFPDWIKNGVIIGKNQQGELLAVGMKLGYNHDEAWLFRLAKLNNCWVSVREAIKEDLDKYDAHFCNQMHISLC
jgi:hypothetical protein